MEVSACRERCNVMITVKLMKMLVSLITHCCTVVVTGTPTIANTGQIVCHRDVETLQRPKHPMGTLTLRKRWINVQIRRRNLLKILFCFKFTRHQKHDVETTSPTHGRSLFFRLVAVPPPEKMFDYLVWKWHILVYTWGILKHQSIN